MMICDAHGNEICDGVSEHESERVAQEIADERGEPVWLYDTQVDDKDEGRRFSPRLA